MRGPNKRSTLRARSLRRRSTRAEWVLWLQLRDRRFAGFKFARQEPIGRYYVDFVCREQRLIIEVMAGNILGRGYLAGFGMTIGSVFGRIAGREAAKHALK